MSKHLLGDTDDEEQRIIGHWADLAHENKQLVNDIEDKVWLSERLRKHLTSDALASWNELRRRLPELAEVEYEDWAAEASVQTEERLAPERESRLPSLLRNWAAVWILLAGGALTGGIFAYTGFRPAGETPSVVDGSSILLDKYRPGWKTREGNFEISMPAEGKVVVAMLASSPPAQDAGKLLTLHTSVGSSYQLWMPDSSRVSLNAASSVGFSGSFNQDRIVTLDGEACFEVKKIQTNMHFVVRARGLTVTTEGTVFDVKAYPGDSCVRTSLIEGHVKVQKAGDSVRLNPGEVFVLGDDGKGAIQKLDTLADALSWREGKFDFIRQPITGIMGELCRWFGKTVEYREKPDGLFNLPGSHSESLILLLNRLENTGHVQFDIQGNKIIVRKNH